MEPRITLITLAVDDLHRALAFDRDGLGWPTEGIVGEEFEHGAVAFFDLHGGLRLALFGRDSLARDIGISLPPAGAGAFTLAHNVRSQQEVDAVVEQARQAGARVVKAPQPTFWGGYAGYFQDLDGHLWEVAFNPQWTPALS